MGSRHWFRHSRAAHNYRFWAPPSCDSPFVASRCARRLWKGRLTGPVKAYCPQTDHDCYSHHERWGLLVGSAVWRVTSLSLCSSCQRAGCLKLRHGAPQGMVGENCMWRTAARCRWPSGQPGRPNRRARPASSASTAAISPSWKRRIDTPLVSPQRRLGSARHRAVLPHPGAGLKPLGDPIRPSDQLLPGMQTSTSAAGSAVARGPVQVSE